MAKIYTKTGDTGTTGLLGGKRTSKSAQIVELLGTLDEAAASMGILRAHMEPKTALYQEIRRVQEHFLTLGSLVAGGAKTHGTVFDAQGETATLEKSIDEQTQNLQALKTFIIVGDSTIAAAMAHWVRTLCRKVERQWVIWAQDTPEKMQYLAYVNRLSDYFFTVARTLAEHPHQSPSST